MRISLVVIGLILLTAVKSTSSSTLIFHLDKESLCSCKNVYTRLRFTVLDGALSNVKLVDNTKETICDKYLIKRLILSTFTNHPNGVHGVGVTGYSFKNKNMSNEQCLVSDNIEINSYWFVEDVSIDLEDINSKTQTYDKQ